MTEIAAMLSAIAVLIVGVGAFFLIIKVSKVVDAMAEYLRTANTRKDDE